MANSFAGPLGHLAPPGFCDNQFKWTSPVEGDNFLDGILLGFLLFFIYCGLTGCHGWCADLHCKINCFLAVSEKI